MSLKMAQKVIVPQKKNYVPQFLKKRDINSYITGRISTASRSGDIIFFSLAGPVGDYTGAHTVIFVGFFYKSLSGTVKRYTHLAA
jgi:hypothetical protein